MTVARGFIHTAGLAGISVLLAASAGAGSLTRLDQNHVSVQASGTPVATILAELNALIALDYLYIEPAIQSRRVSVNIERVSLAGAALRILDESGLNFIVSSHRIYVGDPTAAIQIAKAGASQTAATSPAAGAATATPEPSAFELEPPLEARTTAEQALAAATFEASEYKMLGENVHYNDPSFVTYKMRPEVVQRRVNTDVALIP